MSYENPTRLRIGMHGVFAGKDFRIVGRVVMGVEVDGENYFWNEFNLTAATGENATLVFEGTEHGGEWRLFTEFEPDYPLTADDAAQKQVGDELNLTGADVRVTLVQTSHVFRIEGLAPDDLKVGSEANYFNAEARDVMQVVSWTGAEVEYYNGIKLSPNAVDAAFRLPRQQTVRFGKRLGGASALDGSGDGDSLGTGKFLFIFGIIIFIFFITFGWGCFHSTSYEAAPVKRISAALPPLTVGSTGIFDGKNFRITAHAIVEIATVGVIYERHEYELTDDLGLAVLLVCGENPGAKDWTLFTPLTPLVPPTAAQSAAQKIGDTVNVDGVTATIRELFQSTIRQMDNAAPTVWHLGDVRFGYAASGERQSLLVRWDNQNIRFFHGKNFPAKSFTNTFTIVGGQ